MTLKYDFTFFLKSGIVSLNAYSIPIKDDGRKYLYGIFFILAPPQIKNIYPDKTLKAVVGDKVLKIRCEVTGRPKPIIIWIQQETGKIPVGKIRLYFAFRIIVNGLGKE